MNWRWYITGLVIALALFGVNTEQSRTNANQEIVVRFNGDSISAIEAKNAVSEITTQLKAIGVDNVHVSNLSDGSVKVTYFSTLDVITIKNLLYKQENFNLGDTAFNDNDGSSSFPVDSSSKTYKLEIIKIQKDLGSYIGFQGVIVEAKVFSDQYLKPKVSLATSEIDFNPKVHIEIISCTTYPHVAVLIAHTSNKIPEVRAGPLC